MPKLEPEVRLRLMLKRFEGIAINSENLHTVKVALQEFVQTLSADSNIPLQPYMIALHVSTCQLVIALGAEPVRKLHSTMLLHPDSYVMA